MLYCEKTENAKGDLSMVTITSLRLDYGNWGDLPRLQITDTSTPTFGWSVSSDMKNDAQTAYRVVVKQGDTLLWDSDFVASKTQSCTYAGADLPLETPLTFTVWVKNKNGELSEPKSNRFYYITTAFPHTWITDPSIEPTCEQAPTVSFVKEFWVDRTVSDAVLYVCGVGIHQAKLNGTLADTALLDPAFSDYTKRCYMAAIPEVAPFLKQGQNELNIAVANGWRRPEDAYYFDCYNKEEQKFNFFFGPTILTAALHIRYVDGTEEWIHTNADWHCVAHPCTRARLFDGETYDARVSGETKREVAVVNGPGGEISLMTLPPVLPQESYAPQTITCLAPQKFLVDFGQNIAGVCRLMLPKHLTAGQTVVMTHSEEIGEDGDLSFVSMRKAASRDEYIACGEGKDLAVWQPTFTFHGFRYVRVEGISCLRPEDITALCLRTVIPAGGMFRSGSAVLNAVHQAIIHSEQDNMISLLTDCPQRDERMGWLNDATVRFEETPYNFDIGRIYAKVLADIRDQQSAEDGSITCTAPFIYGSRPADPVCSSYLILGEKSYLFADNRLVLERCYEGFKRWEDCLTGIATDHIITHTCYGDWAGPVYACVDGDKDINACHSIYTPGTFMSTGYYYYNARMLSQFAGWLGKEEERQHYLALAEEIKEAILKKWWNEEEALMCTGSQGCQSFALWLGLIPEEKRQQAADHIHKDLVARDYKFTTANLCTRYLLDALSCYGYEDDAFTLLTREEYPSIGFMLQQEATTVWERFELKKEIDMNSHNHAMYGSVDYWMYAYAAGIRPTARGFERVSIQPVYPKGLQSVNATLHTVKGDLTVRWIKRFGQTELRVAVPFGVTADITVGDTVKTVGSGFWTYTF